MNRSNEIKEMIWEFQREHKLSKPIMNVLLEMYRRTHFFNSGDYTAKLCGLFLPSEAKKAVQLGLIVCSSKEIPKSNNWYRFTDKGIEYAKLLYNKIPWKIEDNEYLFSIF